jgi:hypothetical protein
VEGKAEEEEVKLGNYKIKRRRCNKKRRRNGERE